jgi:hypothetical protein
MDQPTTYGVQKTLLAVHTEDRDATKWPTPTHFELELPVAYKNVVTLRLEDIALPPDIYVFSYENQNTKLTVELDGGVFVVEISAGNYTGEDMALELSGRLTNVTGVAFTVYYDRISNRFLFTCDEEFILLFIKTEDYRNCNTVYYENYTNWGLGSYLGFEKKSLSKLNLQTGVYRATSGEEINIYPMNVNIPSTKFVVTAPNAPNLAGDTFIYLELPPFDSIDEVQPYQERSSDVLFNKSGGQHNGSFARIPVRPLSSVKDYLANIFYSDPPLERVQKLRFRFRHHDGRPVFFGQQNFSFSIEITTLRNEMLKNYLVNKTNYKLS